VRRPIVQEALEIDLDLSEIEQCVEMRIALNVVLDKALPAMTKVTDGVLRSFSPARSSTCSSSVIGLGKRSVIDAPNIIPHLGHLRRAKYKKIDPQTGKGE
jgi:hypothetical protein